MAGGVRVDTRELEEEIELIGDRARNASAVMASLAAILGAAVEDEIASEGRGRWRPFAASTIARGRGGGKLLQDTGVLANIQLDSGPDFAEAFSPAPYAARHIKGTKHMPARNPFAIDLDRVLEEMAAAYLEGIEQ